MTGPRFNRCPNDGYGLVQVESGLRECSNPDCGWREFACARCRVASVGENGAICEGCLKTEGATGAPAGPGAGVLPPRPGVESSTPAPPLPPLPSDAGRGKGAAMTAVAMTAVETTAVLSPPQQQASTLGRSRPRTNRALTIMSLAVLSIVLAAGLSLLTNRGRYPWMASGGPVKLAPVWTNPADALEYVPIPAGSFEMGCLPTDAACGGDERPRHRVVIPRGFRIGRTEVTVLAFSRFALATRYVTEADREGFSHVWRAGALEKKAGVSWGKPGFTQTPEHPVVNVSWNDAAAFCEWAGGRLVTEAEWEVAARAGQEEPVFPWGRAEALRLDGQPLANAADESAKRKAGLAPIVGGYDDGFAYTSPVKAFPPNPLGLYGMAGNAAEWCLDRYSAGFYRASPGTDPAGPADGSERVVRGGSFVSLLGSLRTSSRFHLRPSMRNDHTGFRCVIEGPLPSER